MKWFFYILLLLLLLPSSPSRSQQAGDADRYPEFRLRLFSGIEMEGRDGSWEGRSFRGVVDAGYEVRFDADDIATLQVPGERKITEGAWAGAGLGAGVAGLMFVTAWQDRARGDMPFRNYTVHPVLLAVGLVVGGALLGSAIGSLLRSWRDVDLGALRTTIPYQEPALPVKTIPCRKEE